MQKDGRMERDVWKFDVQRQLWSDSIAIRAGMETDGGRLLVAQPMVLEIAEKGSLIRPMAELPWEAAQLLMDSMWSAGLRPSQSISSTGQAEAIKYHLEDMRRLVFKDS